MTKELKSKTDVFNCAIFLNANNIISELSIMLQHKEKNIKNGKVLKNKKNCENLHYQSRKSITSNVTLKKLKYNHPREKQCDPFLLILATSYQAHRKNSQIRIKSK